MNDTLTARGASGKRIVAGNSFKANTSDRFHQVLGDEQSDQAAARKIKTDRLLPIVYKELRKMAAVKMRNEPLGQTLQATALVHEAWLRLRSAEEANWDSKAHFIGAAGQAMRRILVDNARRKLSHKRSIPMDARQAHGIAPESLGHDDYVLMIHESLEHLHKEDPELAEIVVLKFFGGMDTKEIAHLSGASVRTVERQWTLAKARLYQIIRKNGYEPDKDLP